MIEILFRGERKDGKGWAYGYLFENLGRSWILLPDEFYPQCCEWLEVNPETIGQFTGLTDKNGRKIFEGDIISTDLPRDFLIVEFNGGAFVFNCNDGDKDYYDHINASYELKNEYEYGEIIGNIHDNPELLEVK